MKAFGGFPLHFLKCTHSLGQKIHLTLSVLEKKLLCPQG